MLKERHEADDKEADFFTGLHGLISQNIEFFITTAVRTYKIHIYYVCLFIL
jgi:hypothetical protein